MARVAVMIDLAEYEIDEINLRIHEKRIAEWLGIEK